jgi:hypothetical protein
MTAATLLPLKGPLGNGSLKRFMGGQPASQFGF